MYLVSYLILYPIIQLLSRLPYWVLYRISDGLFYVSYYVIKYRKHIVLNNLRLVFPDKSEKELSKIAKGFYRHFGDVLVESVKYFSISDREVSKRYSWKNPDVLQELGKKNKSFILIGSHYANWEYIVHIASILPHKSYGTYNTLKNPYFDNLIKKSRGRFGGTLLPTNETVPKVIENFQKNIMSVYGLVSDQSPMVQKTHYWRTFMGVKVPVHVGAENLAKKYDLAIVYFKPRKVKRGYYEVTFELLAENPKNYKDFELTDRYIEHTEALIKERPELYFWVHKRWKHKDKAPLT